MASGGVESGAAPQEPPRVTTSVANSRPSEAPKLTVPNDCALRLPLLTDPIASICEHGSRRSLGTIRVRQPQGGVVETPTYVRLGGLVLCHLFPNPEDGSTLSIEGTVLGQVHTVRQAEGLSAHLLRWNWAYCADGVNRLVERLDELLALPSFDVDTDRVYRMSSGGLYSFAGFGEDELDGLAERLRDTVQQIDGGQSGRPIAEEFRRPPLERLRAHDRVAASIPCVFALEDREVMGQVYNIAREGIFVASPDGVPRENDPLSLAIALRMSGERHRVVLGGIVQWRMESQSGSRGGGIGLCVDEVRDGRGGAIFHAFLDELIRQQVGNLPLHERAAPPQIEILEPTGFAA